MAKYLSMSIKAAVVAIAVAAYFVGDVSGKDDKKFCDCGAAKNPKNFRDHVRVALDDVVKRTPRQPQDPVTGDATFAKASPAASVRGGAAASATCFGGSFTNCSACLTSLRGFLRPCETSGCAGAEFPDQCFLSFRQIE